MGKFNYSKWSSVAEIIGTIAVVVSLLFVAHSIEKNTEEAQAQQLNDLYDANREIELALASDATWSEIVRRGNIQFGDLSESEKYRYDLYWAAHLNLWEQLIGRHRQGLVPQDNYEGWNAAYVNYIETSLSNEAWQRLKPLFPTQEFRHRVEEALEK